MASENDRHEAYKNYIAANESTVLKGLENWLLFGRPIAEASILSKTAQKTPSDGVTTFLVKQSGGEECASGYTGLSQRSFTSASASYIFSSASLAFLFPAP